MPRMTEAELAAVEDARTEADLAALEGTWAKRLLMDRLEEARAGLEGALEETQLRRSSRLKQAQPGHVDTMGTARVRGRGPPRGPRQGREGSTATA